jgi:autoinducer 2-degrading protein
MLIQVVYLEVQPDKLDTFLAEAAANARASLTEPSVVRFDFLQQADSPAKFMLYEAYRSAEALEAHRHTEHFKRWVEKGVPTLVGDRVRVFYRNIEPEDEHW